ncbi:MAG: sigma-70 family RNA polymerase sigma factor [Labilithrix sp.]|nr:sigma-70 family RNA polymerase sigma factor [Labilithrix sp.]
MNFGHAVLGSRPCPELYGELVRLARRHSRRADEAEELVHDVLAEALRRGVDDWQSPARRGWLCGAVQRRAAFLARCAVRRRIREERVGRELAAAAEVPPPAPAERAFGGTSAFLDALPPTLRSVSVLLATGMSRKDVCYVLGLSDAALRQRLTKLRKLWPADGLDTGELPDTALAGGVLRRALLQPLRRDSRLVLGAFDPDGHPLLFARAGRDRKKSSG